LATYTGGSEILSIAFGTEDNYVFDLSAVEFYLAPGDILTVGVVVGNGTSYVKASTPFFILQIFTNK
jgi:hypothetical protein